VDRVRRRSTTTSSDITRHFTKTLSRSMRLTSHHRLSDDIALTATSFSFPPPSKPKLAPGNPVEILRPNVPSAAATEILRGFLFSDISSVLPESRKQNVRGLRRIYTSSFTVGSRLSWPVK